MQGVMGTVKKAAKRGKKGDRNWEITYIQRNLLQKDIY